MTQEEIESVLERVRKTRWSDIDGELLDAIEAVLQEEESWDEDGGAPVPPESVPPPPARSGGAARTVAPPRNP